ncbi:deoxyribose-phosphate aldolase [Atopobium sp. oral taxon 810]|uniref:deoxyribose-phosphate aldolase n=1 Tax=Atopobium sp. oral taxon 810 TaxID=712158 RepID=UPI000396EE08|nr:deoxyribose-phosphate aldolase [Atopobium sp. oral taxon 810]ERI05868.1 deoxyribose-phosphate aldolase [Atopobium sp. oral taxon 810 str. F0209]
MASYTLDNLARLIDHTNLHADATEVDMHKLCEEAKHYHFKMVAINQVQASFCAKELKGTDIDTGAAIAFPLGQTSIAAKVFETRDAINNGANEIDYVVNLTQVKAHNWNYVADEMCQIVSVCHKVDAPCKAIFENCYLTEEEKIELCHIASEIKPDFIKTSTGFGNGGATIKDVWLMRNNVSSDIQVKAAGGIRTADFFLDLIRAGATRIGCSAGIPIIEEIRRRMEASGINVIEL